MAAQIRVESGISAGTSYWIDRPVLRIGSDPQCEICLPSAELPPHALTLEFRGDQYRAYNRGASAIAVGTTAVPAGGNAIWSEQDTLSLPGDLRLTLEIDGDPRPSAKPDAMIANGVDGTGTADLADAAAYAHEAPAAKKSSNTLVQLAVIGACVVGMAIFLTMGGGEEQAVADRPTFEAIVDKLLAQDESASRLRERLQHAQAALVRDHHQLARERFLALRDRLVRERDAASGPERENVDTVLSYVEFRLGQLQ